MSEPQDKFEYSKITSFYEKVMYFTLGALSFFGSVIIYWTYTDRKSMIEEKEKIISDLKNEIKEVKDESDKTIEKTNLYAKEELSRIKNNTNQIAVDETKKELDLYFSSTKIQDYIERKAINEVKGNVSKIVSAELSTYTDISDAISRIRVGEYEGYRRLKEYSQNLPNIEDREIAKKIIQGINDDYYNQYKNYHPDLNPNDSLQFSKVLKEYPHIKTKNDLIEYLINQIDYDDPILYFVASDYILLSRIAQRKFNLFEREEVKKWYKSYLDSQKKETKLK